MTETDETDAIAGEYVLGTLSAEERLAVESRLAGDRALRRAVAAWERRLQPLADSAPPASPRGRVFERISERLDELDAGGADNVVELRRAVTRWRISTAALTAAAAVLLGVVVFDRVAAPPRQSEFVAVLTAEGAKPAFVATVDVVKGTISLRRVADAAPSDKSYELWAVTPNAAPRSLGLVEQASFSRPVAVPAGDVTLAISLEPKGGSPTGAPTGPVVFTGALVPTE